MGDSTKVFSHTWTVAVTVHGILTPKFNPQVRRVVIFFLKKYTFIVHKLTDFKQILPVSQCFFFIQAKMLEATVW